MRIKRNEIAGTVAGAAGEPTVNLQEREIFLHANWAIADGWEAFAPPRSCMGNLLASRGVV